MPPRATARSLPTARRRCGCPRTRRGTASKLHGLPGLSGHPGSSCLRLVDVDRRPDAAEARDEGEPRGGSGQGKAPEEGTDRGPGCGIGPEAGCRCLGAGAGESDEGEPLFTPPPTFHRVPRALVQALAPGRYRVQFTISQETHDKVRRLQALLRREVPNGDAGLIFERFVDVLLDKVERDKLGNCATPSKASRGRRSVETKPEGAADESRSRSGTTTHPGDEAAPIERRKAPSRHNPSAVTRAVWSRDGAQCAFVADNGHRCTERSFLEVHRIHPHALDGPPTVGNLSLRCRRHNQYEAELVFPRFRPRPTSEKSANEKED